MRTSLIAYSLILLLFARCSFNDEPKLPSVEERISDTIEELNNTLTSSANGWKLNYKPTSETGEFLILLHFNIDGTVRIQSDIIANDGEFIDQTIPYRIDSSQGVELILETYGVFHYLFELQRASFGAEFEFLFNGFDGNRVLFKSKTDVGDITELILEPADTDDLMISTASLNILEKGIFQSQNLGSVGSYGNYNIYLASNDHTISISLDLTKRIIYVVGIAKGMEMEDISTKNSNAIINQSSTFSIIDEVIILKSPVAFSFEGADYTLDQIPLENPLRDVASYCDMQQDSISVFGGESVSLGNYHMRSSLFQARNNFITDESSVHSINPVFLFDESDNSIIDQIVSVFPDVVAFQWYHNLPVAQDTVINAIGFVTSDEAGNVEFYLRAFDFVRVGNHLEISFNGQDLISNDSATDEQLDSFNQLTNTFFSGNRIYISQIPTIDRLFLFYNPCNKHKGYIRII